MQHVCKKIVSQKSIEASSSSTADSLSYLSSLFQTLTINMFYIISTPDIFGFTF